MKTKFAFIVAHASDHAIRFMCRVIGVTRSCGYAWQRTAPRRAERAAWRDSLGAEIEAIFFLSKRRYGFMKPIVAGPGDLVCLRSIEKVDVNGVRNARKVLQHEIDRLEPLLWPICRPLADDEFFMMSMHLQNSFDSRHFGPIGLNQILGSYRSLILNLGMARF